MKKLESSQAAVLALKWVKHSFTLWISLTMKRKERLALKKGEIIVLQKNLLLHMQKREFSDELTDDENHRNIRNHYHYTGKYRGAWPTKDILSRPWEVLQIESVIYKPLRLKAPKEILAVFHNDSNYDYHFIIK